jgi:glycosyltransferase involved in cell wall biosynthesis
MRVLLVTPQWASSDAYGGERSLRLLALGLDRRGHDVRVAAEEVPEGAPDWVRETPMTARGLWRAARAAQPDVLHCYNMDALVPAAVASSLARVPSVATANSYWAQCLFGDMTFGDGTLCEGCSMAGIRKDYRTRSEGMVGRQVPTPLGRAEVARRTWFLNRYDRVVTLSRASAEQMQRGGLREEGVRVVPNMVDPRDLEAEPADLADEPRILAVGQLKQVKGVDLAIEALPRVREAVPEATLGIVGDGPEGEKLRDAVEAAGLGEAVTFHGRVPGDALRDLYRRSRALAFPVRWHEPFGRVLLEAWAHGLPIVTTTRGGPGEIVDDGTSGRIVPPEDPGALADALVEVLDDDARARHLREGGREALTDYELDAVVPLLEDVYREAAGT